MYIHLLCPPVKQDFRLVIELEIYLRGNVNDARIPSPFRDDLDFGKRRCGRTNLNTGRIDGNPHLTLFELPKNILCLATKLVISA